MRTFSSLSSYTPDPLVARPTNLLLGASLYPDPDLSWTALERNTCPVGTPTTRSQRSVRLPRPYTRMVSKMAQHFYPGACLPKWGTLECNPLIEGDLRRLIRLGILDNTIWCGVFSPFLSSLSVPHSCGPEAWPDYTAGFWTELGGVLVFVQ